MKMELSALVDDELEAEHRQAILQTLAQDQALREQWGLYHLIGDQLRDEVGPAPSTDFTARCMAALAEEPVVLAPRAITAPVRPASPWRWALPLAASFMGVGAVAWVAQTVMQPHFEQSALLAQAPRHELATQTTMSSLNRTPKRNVETVSYAGAPRRTESASQLQEYMAAHESYSPWVAVQGAARYQAGMAEAQVVRYGAGTP